MRGWKKGITALTTAGILLLGAASVGSAYAYFTTYTEAAGGVVFTLGQTKTEIDETVEDGKKIVSVKNTGDYACYVRVTAFAGSEYTLTYEDGGSGKWSDGRDGYWYYSELLEPGASTEKMHVVIPAELLQKVQEEGIDQNVIVVQECAPEAYDDGGSLLPNGPARFAALTGTED